MSNTSKSGTSKKKTAAKKSTTSKKKSNTPTLKEVEELKAEILNLKKEKDELLKTKEVVEEEKNIVTAQLTDSVPKEKLRSESFVERINWYYKDLKGTQRVFAHLILLAIIAVCMGGVYFIASRFGDNAESYNIAIQILTFVLGLFGISIQGMTLRTPKAVSNNK